MSAYNSVAGHVYSQRMTMFVHDLRILHFLEKCCVQTVASIFGHLLYGILKRREVGTQWKSGYYSIDTYSVTIPVAVCIY